MRWGWVAGIGAVLVGCTPAGGLRVRYDTVKVRWNRVPLTRALVEPEPVPGAHARIETVLAARSFAAGLALEVGEHFRSLSRTDLDHPGYVLTAAGRLGLQPYAWTTAALGALPFKGFDDLGLARDDAARLEEAGYDTDVRSALAFRSFPWLPMPLLEVHLRRDHVPLARLVLREIYRESFTLPGGHAVAFNESLASFVAHRGAIALFEGPAADPARLRQAEVSWKAERRFAAYLDRLARELAAAYASAPDEATARATKARLLDAARQDLDALSAHLERLGLPRFRPPRNNAALLSRLRRTSGLDLFEAVHERTRDLRRTLDVIEWQARAHPEDPYGAIRAALATAATEPAPTPASPSPGGDPGTPPSSPRHDPAPPAPGT